MYNITATTLARPKNRSYAQYLMQCQRVANGDDEDKVNGVHEVWLLDQLSYAQYIHQTKDSMHSANNTIIDSLKVLKPNTSEPEFENRTRKQNVINSCRDNYIFPFVYAEHATFPWILTKEEVIEHDNRYLLLYVYNKRTFLYWF